MANKEATEESNSYFDGIHTKIDDLTLNQKIDYFLSEVKSMCDCLVDDIIESSDENDDLLYGGINLKYHIATLSDYVNIAFLRCDFDEAINTSDEMAFAKLDNFNGFNKGDTNAEEETERSEETTTSQD